MYELPSIKDALGVNFIVS